MIYELRTEDECLKKISKESVERPEKYCDADRDADHDQRKLDGLSPRRPIHFSKFLSCFLKEQFNIYHNSV